MSPRMPSSQHNRSQKLTASLTSIIIPCWNQLQYTRMCLDAVLSHSGSQFELIFVDNGSSDGTAAFLADLRGKAPVPVTVITNEMNRGFPAAINQGLRAARGEYFVLLNNDTVVTEGWLDRLIAVSKEKAAGDRPIGLVGPMSNYVTPPQVVETVTYQSIDGMHHFARDWQRQHRGRWFPAVKLSGFCLLVTRAAYEAVGGLDERFSLGFFDDDDLALRVRKAGFALVVAQDVFIHHFGSRTMLGSGIDAEALLNENQARFLDKWGAEAPTVVREKPRTRPGRRRVVDAFLFHDELDMLDFRLKMLHPHVDQFIVVEADKTFSGRDKPFYYEKHRQRYAWAADKIIHFKQHMDVSRLNLSTAPTEFQPGHDCWQIEYAQRGAIVAACKDFGDDDLLILSDVDEIPSRDALAWAAQNINQLPAVCHLHFFYYDLRHLRQEIWPSTIICTMGTARSLGTQELRNRRNAITQIANAGWHLSYFGGAAAIIKKIESFSHQELNLPQFKEEEHINRCRTLGDDLFNRGMTSTTVSRDFFPSYFIDCAPMHWWGVDDSANEIKALTSKKAAPMSQNSKARRLGGTITNGKNGRSKVAKRAKISLTMIVRNEEKNLPRCLESVRGVFDEIVVVDTGSTDRTKEIAASFGAKIVDFAWIDDFSAARNAALEKATGDYAFWLDADDVIEPPHKDKLVELLKTLRENGRDAYVLRCFCATSEGAVLAVDHPRLFPLLDGIRWERRIHEVINPALERAGVSMTWTDIVVRHTGYVDETEHERKRQRNLVLLQKELAERPEDPFIYYYLGTLAFERKRWQEALGYFILSLAKWGTTQSIACKLFAMIAWTNQILERYDESLRVANEGLTYFPSDGELWFRKGIALRYLRRPAEAETAFTRILGLGQTKTLYNVEPGIYGYMTRGNLAIIAEERGDYPLARTHWQAVLAEYPGYPEALRRLARMPA